MKKVLLTVLASALLAGFAHAETPKTVPASTNAARQMPAMIPQNLAINTAVVKDKNAQIQTGLLSPVFIGPPIKVPPFGDYAFPKDFKYGFTKDGEQVTIRSAPNVLTIHWEPTRNWTNAKEDHPRPVMENSTDYSFDLKSGKISVTTCAEVCRVKELTIKDGKAFVEALGVMRTKVVDAIQTPRLASLRYDDSLKKLLQIRDVLDKVIKKVGGIV